MDTARKLEILAASARHDASCSSSGSSRPHAPGGLGAAEASGICHTWGDDGRCISLLKILFTNHCMYDCAYCPNRRSNDIPRARFTPREVVDLTMGFYVRNYIEGLFLSSGIVGSPDRTMEELTEVVRSLREDHRFNGYLHLKAIPGADPVLLARAGLYADRMSVNIELPSRQSLESLAPDKDAKSIFTPMGFLAAERRNALELARRPVLSGQGTAGHRRSTIQATQERPALHALHAVASPDAGVLPSPPTSLPPGREGSPRGIPSASVAPSFAPGDFPSSPGPDPLPAPSGNEGTPGFPAAPVRPPLFVPAGQSTQMIIGASPETDLQIIRLSGDLYRRFDLKRVYYSAFQRLNDDPRLPASPRPPLLREHRLYQADWLMRFYRFAPEEILDEDHPLLDRDLDPKTSWALRNPQAFPVDVQTADESALLRVPGMGPLTARRVVRARRSRRLDTADLARMGVVMKRARYFLSCRDSRPPRDAGRPELLRRILADPASRNHDSGQLELFGDMHDLALR